MGKNSHDVGVIVARFQVDDLHKGHQKLIQTVTDECQRVIAILGVAPTKSTREDPLPFQARRAMLEAHYPDIDVLYIKDCPSDAQWSKALDELIGDHTGPCQDIVLYGGRDSFVRRYVGLHPTQTLDHEGHKIYSGTAVRHEAGVGIGNSREWRRGAIWSAHNSYQSVVPTVDVAIFNEDGSKVLLGRKPRESKLRFPGGFVQRLVHDEYVINALEVNGKREVREECGDIEIGDVRYVGSCQVDDWRYGASCRIVTVLFKAKHIHGMVAAGDDLEYLEWVEFDNIVLQNVVEKVHQPLVHLLWEDHRHG